VLILGIESSCDETAAAVVTGEGRMLSSVVASQAALHRAYGGVVPELAARRHIETINPVVQAALDQAGVAPEALDAVAATRGPGLVGALLVGFCFAKAFAFGIGKPFYGVDHLEAHILALDLCPDPPPFPFVALLVSGGHTSLFRVSGPLAFQVLGRTRDDAAGEAFDKVAKLMGLEYPGGAAIEALARGGAAGRIRLPRALLEEGELDFSFSGLKSAVSRYLHLHPAADRADVAAEFQEAVADVLARKALRAARQTACRHLALVGGVAANGRVRQCLAARALEAGLTLHVPPPELCGDNAAMVAAAGARQMAAGLPPCPLDSDVYSRHPQR
jgi:N6-L-threonylcarbamoyladenine synthase